MGQVSDKRAVCDSRGMAERARDVIAASQADNAGLRTGTQEQTF